MEKLLHGLPWRTLLLYLDDIIVMAPDFQSHLDRLREVLDRFQMAGLKLKPSKCALFQPEVCYLGHVVSAQEVATDPDKIEAVRAWPTPKSVKDVQALLGLAGYYWQFIPDFATTANPLSNLTCKGTAWEWTSAHQLAFEAL